MLEEVRVDFLVIRREIWLDVVVELDDLKLDAFLCKLGLYDLEDFGMRHGRCANLDDLLRLCAGIVRTAAAADKGERCECEYERE